jgi:hypothetical protein
MENILKVTGWKTFYSDFYMVNVLGQLTFENLYQESDCWRDAS